MEFWKFWLLLFGVVVMATGSLIGCGTGDDDSGSGGLSGDDTTTDDDTLPGDDSVSGDDTVIDDDAGDDSVPDDDTGTDDDTVSHACGDYDVVMTGGTSPNVWTISLVVGDGGNLSGLAQSENPDQPDFDLTGEMTSSTDLYLDGNFPTPSYLAGDCGEDTVYIHIVATISSDSISGTEDMACGTPENVLGTVDLSGSISCGAFS